MRADPLTVRDTPGYRGGVKAANLSYVRTPRLTRLEYEASPLAAPRARVRVADLLAWLALRIRT
jgi:hypothetical protein